MSLNNEPLRILLADDEETGHLLFKKAFKKLEIITSVHIVNNGIQLMDYLSKKAALLPHLLFLDLNMPLKNGLKCLKEIRSNEKFNEIFIAIFSTSSSEKDMEDTFSSGANIYIHKPADFNDLTQVLEKAVMAVFQYEDKGLRRENFLLRI